MKIFEIRELPEVELAKRIIEEEENLAHLKFQKATSQLESPIKIRTARRTIARMRTVLRELEIKKISLVKKEEVLNG
ncbi:MAG: 50S ribosomal protein L29 [Ignavibacteriales bacterium]|nr:50S ribosomal protein L29 [Ignavibacteriales bacterium]